MPISYQKPKSQTKNKEIKYREHTKAEMFNLKMLCLPFFQATTVNKYAAQIIIIIFAHLISH